MKAKKGIVGVGGFLVLSILLINFSVLSLPNSSFAQGGNEGLPPDADCKWEQERCSETVTREICVTTGNGNTCTCGQTTRACN